MIVSASRWAVGLGLLAGCTAAPPPAPLRPDTAGVAPRVDYAPLAEVLAEGLDGDGNLRRDRAPRIEEPLSRQLALLAVTGPTATPELLPTDAERLAYWYNARAAWALRLALEAGLPDEADTTAMARRRFLVDGRLLTLEGIDRAIMTTGDWRAVVAAPGLCYGHARLPAAPLEPASIREQVARRFERFVDDARRFEINVRRREVRVPRVLWRRRADIVAWYCRRYGKCKVTLLSALLPHVSGSAHRRLQSAVGYDIVPAKPCRDLAIRDTD